VLGYAPAASRALQGALDLYRAIGATGHAERLARGARTWAAPGDGHAV